MLRRFSFERCQADLDERYIQIFSKWMFLCGLCGLFLFRFQGLFMNKVSNHLLTMARCAHRKQLFQFGYGGLIRQEVRSNLIRGWTAWDCSGYRKKSLPHTRETISAFCNDPNGMCLLAEKAYCQQTNLHVFYNQR